MPPAGAGGGPDGGAPAAPPGIGGGAPAPMPGGFIIGALGAGGAIGGLPAIGVGGAPGLMPPPPIRFDPAPAIALFLAMWKVLCWPASVH